MRQGEENRMDRRQFSRQLAAGAGLVGGIATASTGADNAQATDDPPAAKSPEKPKAEPPEPPPPPEILLLTFLLRTCPNDHFDEVAIQGVFRDIRGDLARGRALAQFPLKNSDEPAFAFRAYRGVDGTPADK